MKFDIYLFIFIIFILLVYKTFYGGEYWFWSPNLIPHLSNFTEIQTKTYSSSTQ